MTCFLPRHVWWRFPRCCWPFPSWIHLLPGLSESLPLMQATNPNLASLVIIINVLFTPSSRSLMKMLNDTRMKPCPRGIPLDTFQQLDTLPFAVSLPFVYFMSPGPCFSKRQKTWYFYGCRDVTLRWVL